MSRIHRIRAGAVAILAAMLAVLGLSVAPASAATAVDSAGAVSQPIVNAGSNAQLAGDITVTISGVIVPTDTVTLTLDDNDGGANCPNATDFVAWNAVPTITTTAGTAPAFTASLASPGTCGGLAPPQTDQLKITFNDGPGSGPFTLRLSNVKYNVGTGVATGPVQVSLAGSAPDGTVSNATIATVNASTTPTSIATDGGQQSVNNIVFTELASNAISGTVCALLTGAAHYSSSDTFGGDGFNPTPLPTITSSPSGDTVSGISNAIDQQALTFTVTSGSPSPTAAFTVGGIKLTPDGSGPVLVQLFDATCAGIPLSNTAIVAQVTGVFRMGGADRFATAEIIAEQTFGVISESDNNGSCVALIARGDLFPDALAGNYLAGAQIAPDFDYAPILLVNTGSIPLATLNALKNLGTRRVYILGQTAAVSKAVEDQLAATPTSDPGAPGNDRCTPGPATQDPGKLIVERVGGQDRYETAKAIAERAGLGHGGTLDATADTTNKQLKTAIVTTGENFPDALTAGPMAFAGSTGSNGGGFCCGADSGFPLVLTNGASLNSNAAAALQDKGIKQVIIVGGPNAVSTAVETALKANYNVIRIGGATRQDTATGVATMERAPGSASDGTVPNGTGLNWGVFGLGRNHINLARGDLFPDSLTGGPHAGLETAPIVLTENPSTLGTPTKTYLNQEGTRVVSATQQIRPINSIDVFGGTSAVSAAVATAAATALTGA